MVFTGEVSGDGVSFSGVNADRAIVRSAFFYYDNHIMETSPPIREIKLWLPVACTAVLVDSISISML